MEPAHTDNENVNKLVSHKATVRDREVGFCEEVQHFKENFQNSEADIKSANLIYEDFIKESALFEITTLLAKEQEKIADHIRNKKITKTLFDDAVNEINIQKDKSSVQEASLLEKLASIGMAKQFRVSNSLRMTVWIIVVADPNSLKMSKLGLGIGQTGANIDASAQFKKSPTPTERYPVLSGTTHFFKIHDGKKSYITATIDENNLVLFFNKGVSNGDRVTILSKHLLHPVSSAKSIEDQ